MPDMKITLLAAAALVAVPTLAVAQTTAAPQFVKMAGASDKYEIDSSNLVMTSTQDPKVRQFAQQMISDHTNSTAQIKAAAASDRVPVGAPMLNAMQRSNIAKLRAAKGAARDKMYWQQQATSHQMALQLHQGYASAGDKPALKAAAGQIVPVVQSHVDMLKSDGAMAAM